MSIYGFQLHAVTFWIIVLECLLLSNQILKYLEHPKETQRLWQLILLAFVIFRNVVENAFRIPNPNFHISPLLHNFLGYGSGYISVAYFPIYWYKTLQLDNLKFHGRYGFLFIILPVIIVYGVIYPITKDIIETRKYVYIVPGLYGLCLILHVLKSIIKQYLQDKNRTALGERILSLSAIVPWMLPPVLTLGFDQPVWVIDITLNAVFLILNFLMIYQIVKKSREEQNERDRLKTNLSDKEMGIAYLEKEKEEQGHAFAKALNERDQLKTNLSDKEMGIAYLEKEKEEQGHAFKKALEALKQNNTDPMLVFEFNCQLYKLSPAEIRVVKQVRLELLNKEIAGQFGRSIRTIEKQMTTVYLKADIKNDKDDSSMRANLMRKLKMMPDNIE